MKISKKNFLSNTHISETILNAVLEQIGLTFKEFAENANDYRDASAGASGFIYYSETHKFAIENQSVIVEMLEETAEQMGEEVVTMVKNFGIFKGQMDNDELKDLYKYLSGGEPEQGQVTNIMAWFALEETANAVIN